MKKYQQHINVEAVQYKSEISNEILDWGKGRIKFVESEHIGNICFGKTVESTWLKVFIDNKLQSYQFCNQLDYIVMFEDGMTMVMIEEEFVKYFKEI